MKHQPSSRLRLALGDTETAKIEPQGLAEEYETQSTGEDGFSADVWKVAAQSKVAKVLQQCFPHAVLEGHPGRQSRVRWWLGFSATSYGLCSALRNVLRGKTLKEMGFTQMGGFQQGLGSIRRETRHCFRKSHQQIPSSILTSAD